MHENRILGVAGARKADGSSMYFIAVMCPPAVDGKVLAFKKWMHNQFGCTVALKSSSHITLVPPFWLENFAETKLLEIFQAFTPGFTPADITLDGFDHFGKRVLFVNVNKNRSLLNIKEATELHFMQHFPAVIKKDDRPFHPHVTIANRDVKPSDFEKAWEHFATRHFYQTFPCDSISLLKLENGKWQEIARNAFVKAD